MLVPDLGLGYVFSLGFSSKIFALVCGDLEVKFFGLISSRRLRTSVSFSLSRLVFCDDRQQTRQVYHWLDNLN